MEKYTCPVCGYLVFKNPPGSDEICPICFWHDDISQLRFQRELGANNISLIDAQKNYLEFSAKIKEVIEHVRSPKPDEVKDPEWRPIDVYKDKIEEYDSGVDNELTYPNDPTKLYYWKE